MESEIVQISKDIAYLKKAIEQIQLYIEDSFLTPEEELLVKEGKKELDENRTISFEALKKKYV
ncbi:hypothetical protein J4218_04625 [Candidatus Pacearchaeota archaeon]|nr:hypothetical protein [Candidatus Pacearchaeota archaeon]